MEGFVLPGSGPRRDTEDRFLPHNIHLDSSVKIKATSLLYKKSIKPLIERKRRARINASLEQLKGLLEGEENAKVSKLEKADLLELTVRHLQKLKRSGTSEPDKNFTDGYSHCQTKVSSFLGSVSAKDPRLQSQLLNRLEPTPSQPYLDHSNEQPGKSGHLQSTATHPIWKAQKFMAPDAILPLPADKSVPFSHLPAQPPPAFQTMLPPRRPSALIPGPSAAYCEATLHRPPGLVTHQPLTASADSKQFVPYREGAPHRAHPASGLTLSALGSSPGIHNDTSMLQIYHNSPLLLPGADLSWPRAQGSPVHAPQVWRPW